jgi:eukaryotic translation initiation factor 2C
MSDFNRQNHNSQKNSSRFSGAGRNSGRGDPAPAGRSYPQNSGRGDAHPSRAGNSGGDRASASRGRGDSYPSRAAGPPKRRSPQELARIIPDVTELKPPDYELDPRLPSHETVLSIKQCTSAPLTGRSFVTNHYKCNLLAEMLVFQFDVSIVNKRKEKEVSNKGLRFSILLEAMGSITHGFDGSKICYSFSRDPLLNRVENYEVDLTFAREVNFSNVDPRFFAPDQLQCLNILFLQRFRIASTRYAIFRSSIYSIGRIKAEFQKGFEVLQGINISFKSSCAGLILCIEACSDRFLQFGSLIELFKKLTDSADVKAAMRLATTNSLVKACIEGFLKGKKLVRNYGFKKLDSFHAIGLAADDPKTSFVCQELKKKVTVAQYYQEMHHKYPDRYRELQHPKYPTIEVGSRRELIPVEFLSVKEAQRVELTGRDEAEAIKASILKPERRYQVIVEEGQEFLQPNDLIQMTDKMMPVNPRQLPPPELQFGGSCYLPDDKNSWKPSKFLTPANVLNFLPIFIGNQPALDQITDFVAQLVNDANKKHSLSLTKLAPLRSFPSDRSCYQTVVAYSKGQEQQAHFLLVVLEKKSDYEDLKLVLDENVIISQVVMLSSILTAKCSSEILLPNLNEKLGGVHRCLAAVDSGISLSRHFEFSHNPTMFVGIDVSKPGPGVKDPTSSIAVVGSMDENFVQYQTALATVNGRKEILDGSILADLMKKLLQKFNSINGTFPKKIVVFRDGVSEGEYEQVVSIEIPQIKYALDLCGCVPDSCKVSLIVCQKRHKNRVFELTRSGYVQNPPPGLLITSRDENSFLSSTLNEYLINSHQAIIGTSKACKYTLLYDETHFQLSELYRFTYWLCFLYARCNKSVSYVTPAYYAHLASKKAGLLGLKAGMVSDKWLERDGLSMFFL